jgi:hypothetical protein
VVVEVVEDLENKSLLLVQASQVAGLPVTATGYPITVGAGGTGRPASRGGQVNNSVFSTITSSWWRQRWRAVSPNTGTGDGGSGGGGGTMFQDVQAEQVIHLQ